jgi:hypothetical protein
MFGRLRMRPVEVERLTEVELVLCLDDDLEKRRSQDGGQEMAPADLVAYARSWRAQSLRQRLQRAREGGW